MNIDLPWLDDTQLLQLSLRTPSTIWGRNLMQSAWPRRYPGLVSSDTYRGCAIVLNALRANLRHGATLQEIEFAINAIHDSLQVSQSLRHGSDRHAGAALTVTNAWESSHSGVTPPQYIEALESELIFVATRFAEARRHEAAGRVLA
jgi:hypothetical protein